MLEEKDGRSEGLSTFRQLYSYLVKCFYTQDVLLSANTYMRFAFFAFGRKNFP